MTNKNQKTLFLFYNGFIDELALEQEMEHLNEILQTTASPEQFCIAHELVDRNRIISNKRRIMKVSGYIQLRAFRFLINKN
jgi:hypothetical protein